MAGLHRRLNSEPVVQPEGETTLRLQNQAFQRKRRLTSRGEEMAPTRAEGGGEAHYSAYPKPWGSRDLLPGSRHRTIGSW